MSGSLRYGSFLIGQPGANRILLFVLEYTEATRVFRKLADPNGQNNPLSQVLYALSLRLEIPPLRNIN